MAFNKFINGLVGAAKKTATILPDAKKAVASPKGQVVLKKVAAKSAEIIKKKKSLNDVLSKSLASAKYKNTTLGENILKLPQAEKNKRVANVAAQGFFRESPAQKLGRKGIAAALSAGLTPIEQATSLAKKSVTAPTDLAKAIKKKGVKQGLREEGLGTAFKAGVPLVEALGLAVPGAPVFMSGMNAAKQLPVVGGAARSLEAAQQGVYNFVGQGTDTLVNTLPLSAKNKEDLKPLGRMAGQVGLNYAGAKVGAKATKGAIARGKSSAFTDTFGKIMSNPAVQYFDPTGVSSGVGALYKAEQAFRTEQAAKTETSPAPPPDFDPNQYVREQVRKREVAKKGETPNLLSRTKSFLADTKAKLVDFAAPIEDTLAAAAKKGKFSVIPKYDIGNQIDRVLRAPTLAGQFAKDHGIDHVIRQVDDIDMFGEYLLAKHAATLEKKGITTGRDAAKDQALVAAVAPKYEGYAAQISQYSRDLLDYTANTGMISKELAASLKKEYPDYVPFERVFSEVEKQLGQGNTKAVASLSKQSIVQKIKGSVRQIEHPLESLLGKTHDAFVQGEKNIAARLLASYEKLPDNPFQLKELKPGETAPHTVSYLDQGVKRTYATTPEIAQAAKSLNVQQLNILGKIFAAPVRLARIGITGWNIPFVGANIARDQVSAFVNSKQGLKTSIGNPLNFTKALFSAVGHGRLYQEMVREGGAGTSFDIARNQAPLTLARMRSGKNIKSKILYTVRHPSELLRAVENIIGRSEEFTRIKQYAGTRDALLSKGMSPENAKASAAKAAREDTVNFMRRGEYGHVLNSAFLYLNASIQGTRTLLRNFKDRPVATGTKIAVAALYPMAVVTAWNLADPERRAAYEDLAAYEKENNLIIIPPNPTQDEDGKWNVIKIPLSQEINNLTGIPRRAVESAYNLKPLAFNDIASAIIGTVLPVDPTLSTFIPQAIKPSIEGVTNTDLFTNYPIVPAKFKDLSPENQVQPNTSGTARQIGGLIGQSPLKVEQFIKSTAGGVGKQLLNASDTVLAGLNVIPPEQIGGESIPEGITARFSKARGGETAQEGVSELQDVVSQQENTRNALRLKAESVATKLNAFTSEEQTKKLTALKTYDKALYDQVKDAMEDQKKGLTYKDKLILKLGVENKQRATYIIKQLQTMSAEEKVAYVKELKEKEIITKEVSKQLREFLGL